ncbi:MAG: hypothetical protein JXB07_11515 [Anaerolineae bacterium]|nr:hypothetical protein [Anaerolineae bacterium]
MSQISERGRSNFIIGLMLIGFGGLFLLGQVLHVGTLQLMLPFFFILPGILFFVGMIMGGKTAGPLAIPGSIVMAAGLILLFQGFARYYQSWAYAWALVFPASVGVGFMLHGKYSDESRLVQTGRRWLTVGLAIFLGAGAFFELLIFSNSAGRVVLPVLMIGLGAYLLLRRGSKSSSEEQTAVVGTSEPEETRPPSPTKPIKAPAPPPPPEFEPIDKPRRRKSSSSQE